MKHDLRRAGALSCALLSTAAWAVAAAAQGGPNPPPRQDTQSPAGVSLATGAFSHQDRDLAIGGGGFPVGLSLERSYLSSLDADISAYSGTRTQGWTNNLNIRVSNRIVEAPGPQTPQQQENYLYSVTIGTRSIGFTGGSTNPTGNFIGTYQPVDLGSHALQFAGDENNGKFTFIDEDGSRLVFNSRSAPGRAALAIESWTAPDGTRADFSYDAYGLRSVISNRGYALLFEYAAVPGGGYARTKACAVNMARTYVTASSACPSTAQTVSYHYLPSATTSTGPILTGATNAAGGTTTYAYTRGHLSCITLPEEAGCRVSNSYSICIAPIDPDAAVQQEPPGMRNHEQVLSQLLSTGQVYTYSFAPERECPPQGANFLSPHSQSEVTMTAVGDSETGNSVTQVTINGEGLPISVTDPLGRVTEMSYTGPANWTFLGGAPSTPASVTRPEGNRILYTYDPEERGRLVAETIQAKPDPATGVRTADDIVRRAQYPAGCPSERTCNQPLWVEDARGNRTTFTHDPAHGGVVIETGPAVNGVQPQVRYTYEQRYAWILNGSGGYSPAATPVWVRTSERRCRTSAATGDVGTPCQTPNDESVTVYGYGPDAGPNNLQLRGTVVDPGGATLRSCFAYDSNGNRTGETSPRAGLANCP